MSWITQLSFQDLQRLRAVVRRVHMRHYPTHHQTLREADRIIESIGPKTAEAMIKAAVDSKMVD